MVGVGWMGGLDADSGNEFHRNGIFIRILLNLSESREMTEDKRINRKGIDRTVKIHDVITNKRLSFRMILNDWCRSECHWSKEGKKSILKIMTDAALSMVALWQINDLPGLLINPFCLVMSFMLRFLSRTRKEWNGNANPTISNNRSHAVKEITRNSEPMELLPERTHTHTHTDTRREWSFPLYSKRRRQQWRWWRWRWRWWWLWWRRAQPMTGYITIQRCYYVYLTYIYSALISSLFSMSIKNKMKARLGKAKWAKPRQHKKKCNKNKEKKQKVLFIKPPLLCVVKPHIKLL